MVANAGGYPHCNDCDKRLPSLPEGNDVGQRPSVPSAFCKGWRSYRRAVHRVERFGLPLFSKTGMVLKQTGAPVPPQNGIIITGRSNRFSLLEASHCLFEQRRESVRRAADAHLRFGAPFMQQARVIEALVGFG